MSLVKTAAKILDENPGINPLEALRLAREQYVRVPRGKRSEAEKAILRARREQRRKHRDEVFASLKPQGLSLAMEPRHGYYAIEVKSGKDVLDSQLVPLEPVVTLMARIRATATKAIRIQLRSVFQ